MRSKALFLISALLICSLISNSSIFAQSRDRTNPTPLRSHQISGFAGADSSVHWYKLTAGPRELLVWMHVNCIERTCGGVSARFVLWDKNMQAVMDESLIADPGQSKRKNKSLILQSKQDVLLSIGHGSAHGKPGTYEIQFKGALDLPPKESEKKDD